MSRLYLPDSEAAFERHVLFAAELVDPVTLAPVSRGVTVAAPPLARSPLRNHGGRFVWLREGDAWPDKVIVVPSGLPYEVEEKGVPRPVDLARATDTELLVRVFLRPRRDYPFPDGVTVVRGRLGETADGAPVTDAEIWLEWYDTDRGGWSGAAGSTYTRSAGDGEFAAFLRLPPAAAPEKNLAGLMHVQLRARRPGGTVHGWELHVPQGRRADNFKRLSWLNPDTQ